jgi:serine protease Do
VDIVKAVVSDLIVDGKINRGYIGVQIQTVDATYAKSLGLNEIGGVLVQRVIKDGPAEKAGLEVGDVILEFDGKAVKSSNELQSLIVKRHANDVVNLTIWRDGKKIYKSVKLEPREQDKETCRFDLVPS